MSMAEVNGVRLFYEMSGNGDIPMVLVHGSWGSHDNWWAVVPGLRRSFQVLTYDRRGHSASERPPEQGSVLEDVADLAALLEHLGLSPAWVVGNSFGASIALRLAGARPDVLRGLIAHEPPLFSLLAGDTEPDGGAEEDGAMGIVLERIATGNHAGAAELFVDAVAIGPGAWAQLPPEMQDTFIYNAPTFLDECQDPEQFAFEIEQIRTFPHPSLLTRGETSPPPFAPVVGRLAAALPNADVVTLTGAGHIPHVTHPDAYVETLRAFVLRNS